MAVCGLDASVHTMNNEFGALISADLSSCVYGLFLGCKMAAGALSAATLNIPMLTEIARICIILV